MKIIHVILIVLSLPSVGQIIIDWKGDDFSNFQYKPDSTFNSWKEYNASINLLQKEAYSNGFLNFSIDSLVKNDSLNYSAYLKIGNQFSWDKISLKDKQYRIPNHIKGKWQKSLVLPSDLANRLNNIVTYYQNNGYPFAKANLDSITISNRELSAIINLAPGPKIVWDEIKIEGDAKLKPYYFANYLGIQKGKSYDESLFLSINKRLKELPFAKSIKAPEVKFTKDKATVILYLKAKSANFINGVIGVLPNTSSALTGDESQLVITGDLKLHLGNSFGYGEKLKINWKRIQAETQELKTDEDIPFIFKSPFGFSHNLNLLKQDTSFITYKNQIGLKYDISSEKYFTAFWENEGTNKLSNQAINQSNLTSNSGSKNAYGFKFHLNLLDYKFNPRKGFLLNLEAKAGLKKLTGIKQGEKIIIPFFETEDISSSLLVPETSMIYESEITVESYIPIWKALTLKIANNSGLKQNDFLLDNELFRLGGFQLLRGFDQQSVFVTNYSIFTTEIRFLFEENSNLNLFWDQSIIQKLTLLENELEYPIAFGAGINFETKPGIFSLSYALGKFSDTPLQFSSAKIHFGFVNLF